METKADCSKTVNIFLHSTRVTPSFREAVFDAANRSGLTPSEFVLRAAAEKLKAKGDGISGVFRPNDFNGGMA